MRTKILLIAAAALVAGYVSSQAQTVYSANVVGYVNVTTTGGQYALLANPLNNGTNDLNSLFPSAPNGTEVDVWNGTGYTLAQKSFGSWSTDLILPPGTGFFIKFGANTTNTFVGSVVAANGGSVTNNLAAGVYSLVGSEIPYSDTLSGTNLNLPVGNGSEVDVWTGSGYSLSQKSFGSWSTDLTISPGEGFFVKSATAASWVQTFNQ